MILFGIAATPDTAIGGMFLQAGAFDINSEVPLLHRHERAIGRVLALSYSGDKLMVTAETDDDVGRTAGYLSPGFRVLEHRNGRVTRASLAEISITGDPVNPACRILERRERDPLLDLFRAHCNTWDLLGRGLTLCQQALIATVHEMAAADAVQRQRQLAATAAAAPAPLRAQPTSFGSMVEQLNARSEA
jgi:hypothetical protein